MNWSNIIKYPGLFLLAGLMTTLLIKWFCPLAARLGLVDEPRGRHIHKTAVPCVGGLAVFFGVQFGFLVYLFSFRGTLGGHMDGVWWLRYAALSTLIVGVGVVDDRWDMRPIVKLIAQVILAVLSYFAGMQAGKVCGIQLLFGLDLLMTVIWFLLIINAFNLIDGMDGLATGLAAIAATGLCISFFLRRLPGDALVMLIIMGAAMAFLRYNFHPARCFLGDSGSMFIGYTLAAVALQTGTKGTAVASIGLPFLVVGVPLFDTMLAVWRRSVRKLSQGESGKTGDVMTGDLEHLHHRLLRRGLSQRRAAYLLYAVNLFCVVVGLLIVFVNSHAVGIAFVAFVIAVYVAVKHLAVVELWDSGSALLQGVRKPPKRAIAVMLYPFIDVVVLSVAQGIALMALSSMLHVADLTQLWLQSLPLAVVVPFLIIWASNTYRRVWSRARVSEYVILSMGILAGVVVATALQSVWFDYGTRTLVLSAIITGCLSCAGVLGARAFPRFLIDVMGWRKRAQSGESGELSVLIYGAGNLGTLLLRRLNHINMGKQHDYLLKGFLDDDSNLWTRIVFGYRVFGGIDQLQNVIDSERIDKVILAANLAPVRRRRLLEIVMGTGVELAEWTPELVDLPEG